VPAQAGAGGFLDVDEEVAFGVVAIAAQGCGCPY